MSETQLEKEIREFERWQQTPDVEIDDEIKEGA